MEKKDLGFVEFISYNGKIYFDDIFTGNIVCLDLAEDVFEVLSQGNQYGKMQYGALKCSGNNLIFAPRNATNILIYNIETDKMGSVDLDLEKIDGKPLFLNIVSHENQLYFIPGKYASIITLNNKTFATEYIGVNKEIGRMFSSCNGWIEHNKICVLANDGTIVKADCEKGTIEEKRISMIGLTPLTSLDYGEKQIFAGFGPKIMILAKEEDEIQWIDTYKNCEEPKEGYCNLLCIDQEIYMVVINQPKIYKLSLQTKEISQFIDFEWGRKDLTIWNKFTKCDVVGAGVLGKSLLIYSTVRNAILEINVDTKEVRYHDYFRQEETNRNKRIQEFIKNAGTTIEGVISLREFLEALIY